MPHVVEKLKIDGGVPEAIRVCMEVAYRAGVMHGMEFGVRALGHSLSADTWKELQDILPSVARIEVRETAEGRTYLIDGKNAPEGGVPLVVVR